MDSASGANPEPHTRIRQQEVVAELGQQALETDDLDQLMHDASVAVAETLENDYAKVLELLPGGDEVLLRQGVGWRDGLVGSATVPTDLDSQAGYTLLSEQPIIVDDLPTEDRFSGPELLTSHEVVSGISVVIGSVEDPWGVLGTHTTERREFTDHDATFVQSVANVLAAAIDRAEKEQRLREREAQLDVASKAASIGLWTWDIQENVVTADEYLAESYGMDSEAVAAGAPMEDFYEPIHEDDTEQTWEQLERAVEETGELKAEYRIGDATDDVMWVVARGEVEYDDDGEPVRLNGAIADITERKERERELEQSERRYRTLAENFPSGAVGMYDHDLRYTLVEGPIWNEIDPGPDDLQGNTVGEALPPKAASDLEPLLRAAVEEGKTDSVETEFAGRIFRVWATPLRDADGDIFAGLSFAQDTTERKERERELERALDLLDKTERIADVGGWEIDVDTTDVFWTDHIFDLLEVTADEEPPLDEALDMYHEDDQPIVEGAVENALDSGDPFDVEVRLRTAASGKVRWLRLQGVPEIVDDEVVSFRGAAQDITERKQREQRLEEFIDRLEESNKRLEQFAYAASHDLQEPLRMVSSYLQLIERRYSDALDEDGEEFLEFAVGGADRMREMIEGLLEYSRVETKGDLFESVDLDAALEDALTDLQRQIEDSSAEITAEELPRVEGDASQLRQVFQNLLSNAIEYSGDEPPRIHVSAERNEQEWIISVSDEGIGIAPEDQERVFQVFQRLHTVDEHRGTGIGLALCERIIERHRGDIWVESEPGEGATFSVTLPAASDHDV